MRLDATILCCFVLLCAIFVLWAHSVAAGCSRRIMRLATSSSGGKHTCARIEQNRAKLNRIEQCRNALK